MVRIHWIEHNFEFGSLQTIAVFAQQVLHIDLKYKHAYFAFVAPQTIVVSAQQLLQLCFVEWHQG